MIQSSTEYKNGWFPASNVLILGEEDAWSNGKYNYWVGEGGKTTGQWFTLKIDDACSRMIAGIQIKNLGKGLSSGWATKQFKVSASMNANGPWQTLVEDQLVDTSRGEAASLLNFTFEKPVEVKFLKFDMIRSWGISGGGLQYFAAIPATSKQHQTPMLCMINISFL